MFKDVPDDIIIVCDGTTYDTLNSYRNVYDSAVWSSEALYNQYSSYGWKNELYRTTSDSLMEAYQAEVQKASALQESDYEAVLWTDFQKILEEAEVLAQSGETTYEKFMNQVQARKNIIAGVKTFLKSTYEKGQNLIASDYDTGALSWWDYEDAMDDAVRVLDSSTADTEEVAKTEKNLRNAIDSLDILPTDEAEAALNKIIASAGELKESDYTQESWQNLQKIIAESENIKVKGTISQIEAAQKEVEAAIEDLVKAVANSNTNSGTNSSTASNINSGTNVTNPNQNKSTVKKPTIKKVAIKKLKSSKKKTLLVQWKKLSGVSGYQIQIATNKKFTKGKKSYIIKKAKTTKKTIKKLKSKKKYYIRVCAYKTVSGKKYYGSFSAVKKVKVK